MYCTDFICTYKLLNNNIEQDSLYRSQLLQALSIPKWHDQIVEDKINTLFLELNKHQDMKQIYDALRNNTNIKQFISMFSSTNDENSTNELLFRMLFCYQYFDLAHRCFIDMKQNEKVNDDILNNLIKNINAL